jgi:hypothetical protein
MWTTVRPATRAAKAAPTAVEYCVNRSAVDEHQEDRCGAREHVSRL